MTPAPPKTLVHQASVTSSHLQLSLLLEQCNPFDWVVLSELLSLHHPVLILVYSTLVYNAGFEQVVASKITSIPLIGNILEKISGYSVDIFSASRPAGRSLEVFARSWEKRYGHVESISFAIIAGFYICSQPYGPII
jgi:hypothetical protein